VAPADYDALQCDAVSCTPKVMAAASFVVLAPVLAEAGFYPASPLPQPSSNKPGTGWNHYTNVSGLVTGVTKLGDELSLLYTPGVVNGSIFGSLQSWLWNGKTFAKSSNFGYSHATIIFGRCLIHRDGMGTCSEPRLDPGITAQPARQSFSGRRLSGNTVGSK